jgi:hypothetical protein
MSDVVKMENKIKKNITSGFELIRFVNKLLSHFGEKHLFSLHFKLRKDR